MIVPDYTGRWSRTVLIHRGPMSATRAGFTGLPTKQGHAIHSPQMTAAQHASSRRALAALAPCHPRLPQGTWRFAFRASIRFAPFGGLASSRDDFLAYPAEASQHPSTTAFGFRERNSRKFVQEAGATLSHLGRDPVLTTYFQGAIMFGPSESDMKAH
jgi:hypothetical protein